MLLLQLTGLGGVIVKSRLAVFRAQGLKAQLSYTGVKYGLRLAVRDEIYRPVL